MAKKESKGYSAETIRKVMDKLDNAAAKWGAVDPANITLTISAGNKKIGRVLNVSLPPVKTCANCSGCVKYCYDIKACAQYPNVIDSRAKNLSVLQRDRDGYFEQIESKIARRRKNKFFRWHVAGDIIDVDYFDRMVQIARRHPDFVFWTYTKNYFVVNAWIAENGKDAIPENLSVMYSEWRGMPMVNPYGVPEFSCHFPDEPAPDCWKCPGNCDVCKAARRGCLKGENTYCDLH